MRIPDNLCLISLFVSLTLVTSEDYCPKRNETGEPRFTQKLGNADNVRLSHTIPILCCAEGYDRILWYRFENSLWVSYPPPPEGDYNTPKVEENGQILRIFDAKLTDQTKYRCDVIGKTKTIQHITELNVIECDRLPRGPIQTPPYPENKTIYEYGGNITLHCTGYFGCQDKGDWALQLAFWLAEYKNVTEVSPRYRVKVTEDLIGSKKQADLYITDVQEVDTERKFLCVLASPQLEHGETKTEVRIFKKDKPNWLKIGLIIGGSVLFVIIIIILLLLLRCLYGPQIMLFLSSRISALGPKTIDREQLLYNLYLYHAEEDARMAQEIKKYLEDQGYDVYINADMGGNRNLMLTPFEKCHQSAMVLFLYSDELRKDGLANFILQSVIIERKGKDIMFLEATTYKPEEVRDWTLHAKANDEQQGRNLPENNEDNSANTGFENDRSIEEQDGVENIEEEVNSVAQAEKKTEIVDDLKFWKVLPRIKWPFDEKSKRKKCNFWCSLQNKIPKFKDQKDIMKRKRNLKDRLGSLSKPLLNSCRESEPLTPQNLPGSPREFSPNTDDVFEFGGSCENELLPRRINKEETVQTLVSSIDETVVRVPDTLPAYKENKAPENRSNELCRNDVVREKVSDDSMAAGGMELSCAVDVHNLKNSELQDVKDSITVPKSQMDNVQSYSENEETSRLKIREEMFTMSDEEPKAESGYGEGSSPATDHTYESGSSPHHELHSYNSSSGYSDATSEGFQSPQQQLSPDFTNVHATDISQFPEQMNRVETVNQTMARSDGYQNTENYDSSRKKVNGNLSLKCKPVVGNSSSSTPESGYITSPSERTLSTDGFLQQTERKIEAIAEEA